MTFPDKAKTFAIKAHGTQKRLLTGIPFVSHPIRVAKKAKEFGLNEDTIIAAYLHDVLEDTQTSLATLSQEFPPKAVEIVVKLTESWIKSDSQEIVEQKKQQYYENILKDHNAICLKLLDRSDNLLSMIGEIPEEKTAKGKNPSWTKKYLIKTKLDLSKIYASCKNQRVRDYFDHAISKAQETI